MPGLVARRGKGPPPSILSILSIVYLPGTFLDTGVNDVCRRSKFVKLSLEAL
jgi:hypothetical protein